MKPALIDLSEPKWRAEDGRVIPLSQLANRHIQNIERQLRGEGLTEPVDGRTAMWYEVIKSELDKRGLSPLPRRKNESRT